MLDNRSFVGQQGLPSGGGDKTGHGHVRPFRLCLPHVGKQSFGRLNKMLDDTVSLIAQRLNVPFLNTNVRIFYTCLLSVLSVKI